MPVATYIRTVQAGMLSWYGGVMEFCVLLMGHLGYYVCLCTNIWSLNCVIRFPLFSSQLSVGFPSVLGGLFESFSAKYGDILSMEIENCRLYKTRACNYILLWI